MDKCIKCEKSDSELWSKGEIGMADWTKEDRIWFGTGPVCERCIKNHFPPKE